MNKILDKYKKMSISVKAAIWYIICSFLQKGISLVTTPIFTRILSTAEYGQYSLYNSWLEIITIIVTFKLSEAVFNKSLVTNEGNEKQVLSAYQFLSTALWIFWFGVYLILHRGIDAVIELPFAFVVIMFFEILFDNAIKLWSVYQRFNYKYKILILVTLLIAIMNPSLGLVLVQNSTNKVLARLIGCVGTVTVIGSILFAYNIHSLRIQEVKQYWKYALFFNLPLIPHYLSQVLLNQADRIMISKLINHSAVALYSLAYTIGMLASIITQSINNAYVPWMYRALKDCNIKEINKNNQILLGVVACVIMCVFFCAPELILVLGGNKYVESTVVVYPVACSVYFVFVYTLFANIELYYEKRKYVAIGTMYSAVLNIILNWFLIKQFGYVTAAYTTLFCYICYGVFHMFIANKILKMKKITVSLDFYPALIIGGLLVGMSLISQIFINYLAIRIGLFIIIIVVIFTFRKKILMFLQRKMK